MLCKGKQESTANGNEVVQNEFQKPLQVAKFCSKQWHTHYYQAFDESRSSRKPTEGQISTVTRPRHGDTNFPKLILECGDDVREPRDTKF